MVGWCPAVDFCPMWFYHSGFLSYRPLLIAVECFTLYLFLSYVSFSFFILYLILPYFILSPIALIQSEIYILAISSFSVFTRQLDVHVQLILYNS